MTPSRWKIRAPRSRCRRRAATAPAARRTRRPMSGSAAAALCALLCLAPATPAWAQAAEELGRLSGRIVDEDTARPLSLAQISIANLNTGTLSDVDGRWSMSALPPGTYDVVARLIGYAGKTITGVTITAGGVTTIDISLPPARDRDERAFRHGGG